MSAEDTRAVVDHHVMALLAGDLDGIMADYTDDSVLITNLGGVVKGLDAIRAAVATAGQLPGFEVISEHVDGDLLYATWKMPGVSLGTDTFVVKGGKILMQTATFVFAETGRS